MKPPARSPRRRRSIVVPAEEIEALEEHAVARPLVRLGDDGSAAVAMGHGSSFYNHDADPTCEYEAHDVARRARPPASPRRAANEELTIDYPGGGVSQLWFEPRS